MSHSMRSLRSVSSLAAAGALVFALSGCGAILGGNDDSTPTATAEQTTEEATTEAATTEAATTEAAEGAVPEGVQAGPLSEEDLAAGSQVVVDFMNASADGDFAKACGMSVLMSETPVEPITNEALLQLCGETAKGELPEGGAEQLQQVRDLFTVENLTVTDNGDGTGSVSFMGSDMGMKVVKLVDGKMYMAL